MFFGNVNQQMSDQQIAVLPEALRRVIRFLKDTDLTAPAQKTGKFDLQLEGMPVILQVIDQNTALRESLRPEIHRKYIDVQFLAAGGPENIGYYCDDGASKADEDLLGTPRDICFYRSRKDAAEGVIKMTVGSYAVFFPWDVHIPAIQAGEAPAAIRKIVVKVPMDAI